VRPLGLWNDSRWNYALGAFPAALVGCALSVWLASSASGGELIGWAFVAGVPAGLVLSLCSVFGYHMVAANPRLHVVARWIGLCMLTWLFLSMLGSVLLLTNLGSELRVIAPLAAVHAVWTALFLIGRGAPES